MGASSNRRIRSGKELSHAEITAVIQLADRHRKTLGFMPAQGFHERAATGTLLGAFIDGRLAGYVLYDLPGQRVRLIHLCVDPSFRGTGIAKWLVDALSARHSDRLGIALKCRRDWAAAEIWPRLGFSPTRDLPGRSHEGHLLTSWWRDHHHPDLFTLSVEESERVVVALDTDVFSDLFGGTDRNGAEESLILNDPWLAEELQLVVTPELRTELNQRVDPDDRERLMSAASSHPAIHGPSERVQALHGQLVEAIPKSVLRVDSSLRSDALMIAGAVAAGANLFATRDGRSREVFGPLALRSFGLRLVAPFEVALHVDELKRASAYAPIALFGTGHSLAEVAAGQEAQLIGLLNRPSGERKTEFRRRLRCAAESVGTGGSRRILRSPSGDVMALVAHRIVDGCLRVDLLRVGDGPLARTVATQLLFILRNDARQSGAVTIRVVDPAPSAVVIEALATDGFVKGSGGWTALVVDMCDSWLKVATRASQSAALHGAPLSIDISGERPGPSVVTELERRWWPAKILDADVTNYLVPIRPTWAVELFGVADTLLSRDERLGLSREHVYYRSAIPQPVRAPGRILWYSSGDVRAVVACSRLVDVVVARPESLHARFRRLGVWRLEDVQRSANGKQGEASALLVADTEVARRPVPLERVRAFAGDFKLGPLASPTRVPADLFQSVYEEAFRP